MDLVDYLKRQFSYNEWANREVLASLQANAPAIERPLQLYAHILSAESLWLDRLNQQSPKIAVWPRSGLDECKALLAEVGAAWNEYLREISPARLAQTCSYTNSKGEPWSSSVLDVLTHVLYHSAYHRGQIASTMRANGQTPPYTDFIHAARQKLIA